MNGNGTGDVSVLQGQQSPHIVVMGVAGCGKSTIGELLAEDLRAPFLDGDSLHPQSNIAKMSAGTPLNDQDRLPWLEEIGRRFAAAGQAPLVIACSALKRRYRNIIRAATNGVVFVHLDGPADLLAERMNARPGHFMPTSLLQSQLDALEPLEADEAGFVVSIAQSPDAIAAEARLACTAIAFS